MSYFLIMKVVYTEYLKKRRGKYQEREKCTKVIPYDILAISFWASNKHFLA